jgi:hypothetical protein
MNKIDSDVYMFPHVNGGIMCCGCQLNKGQFHSPRFYTYEEAILHLNEHKKKGHKVPQYALDRLNMEKEEFNNDNILGDKNGRYISNKT